MRFALADAPFFAVVRSWKAKHRAALAAEGLELPPLTAPDPDHHAKGRRCSRLTPDRALSRVD